MCPLLIPQGAVEVYKEMVLLYVEEGRRLVNSQCANLEPWQIIAATILATLGAVWVKGLIFQPESKSNHDGTVLYDDLAQYTKQHVL